MVWLVVQFVRELQKALFGKVDLYKERATENLVVIKSNNKDLVRQVKYWAVTFLLAKPRFIFSVSFLVCVRVGRLKGIW